MDLVEKALTDFFSETSLADSPADRKFRQMMSCIRVKSFRDVGFVLIKVYLWFQRFCHVTLTFIPLGRCIRPFFLSFNISIMSSIFLLEIKYAEDTIRI